MFYAERWAAAYADVLGSDTSASAEAAVEQGIAALKQLAPLVAKLPGRLSGLAAARRLEGIIRRAAGYPDQPIPDAAMETGCRFVALLVKRGQARNLNRVIGELEKLYDERRGVLRAVLERAGENSGGDRFTAELEQALKTWTGAKSVRLETETVPGLIGGYRLRAAGVTVDSSIRHALRQLKHDLTAEA